MTSKSEPLFILNLEMSHDSWVRTVLRFVLLCHYSGIQSRDWGRLNRTFILLVCYSICLRTEQWGFRVRLTTSLRHTLCNPKALIYLLREAKQVLVYSYKLFKFLLMSFSDTLFFSISAFNERKRVNGNHSVKISLIFCGAFCCLIVFF